MADEEVDWGMEEDNWRQGGGVPAGENEDEISLDGMEGESDAVKPGSQKAANSPRTSTSRLPPTGPRKPVRRGDEPNPAQGNGSVPAGPKRGGGRGEGRRGRGRTQSRNSTGAGPMSAANAIRVEKPIAAEVPAAVEAAPSQSESQPAVVIQQQPEAAAEELEPLPEGWTEVVSRSQKAVFYHNKLTGETSWVRPRTAKEEDRPITPPPATTETPGTANGTSVAASTPAAAAQSAAAPTTAPGSSTKPERATPTGPSGAEKKAEPAIDPIQSAYANRRTALASRESRPAAGPTSTLPAAPASLPARVMIDRRSTKRSLSPRREETKRTKVEDLRVEPSRTNASRDAQSNTPVGPRAAAQESRGLPSPTRLPGDERPPLDRRDILRPDDRTPQRPVHPQRPAAVARGSNSAPLKISKWGARPDLEAATSTPAKADLTDATRPTFVGREEFTPAVVRTAGSVEDASVRRARLREEAQKAEETLRKIREEEERLEREEEDERRRVMEEADRKRRDEDRLREDDERRRRDEEWRRTEEHRRASDDRERRAYSPGRLAHDERSYRPAGSPPRGPAPSNRLDGPGQPVGLRDARRARPDSPTRIARRTSPAPYPAPHERSMSRDHPTSRYASRGPSPPRRNNGDSYYPDVERVGDRDRKGPSVPLADRIGRQSRRSEPNLGGRRGGGRPRSPPPPLGRDGSFRRDLPPTMGNGSGGYRPLAERMSRDGRESREGWNGGGRDRDTIPRPMGGA